MSKQGWQDYAKLTVSFSTAGNIVQPILDTRIPLATGWGVGWSTNTGTATYDQVSNSWLLTGVSSGTADNGGYIEYTYAPGLLTLNHQYIVSADLQAQRGRESNTWAQVNWYHKSTIYYNQFQSQLPTLDWMTFCTGFTYTDNTQNARIRIYGMRPTTTGVANDANNGWGLRVSNVCVVDVTALAQRATPDFAFREVTCDVQRCGIHYGRQKFTDRYDVGTFTLNLDNIDGDYVYHTGNDMFRPGRLVKMTMAAKGGGVAYPMLYGVIDTINTDMTKDGKAKVSLTAYDLTQMLSSMDTPAFNTVASNATNYKSGSRVSDLLIYGGYPGAMISVDAGQFFMQTIQSSNRSIREEIAITADSEGGAFFCQRDGTVTFRDRTWKTTDSKLNTTQVHFTAVPDNAALPPFSGDPPSLPIICLSDIGTNWSRDVLINHLEIGWAGGWTQPYDDTNSQRKYGVHRYSRTDFVFPRSFGWNSGSDNTNNSNALSYAQTRANDYFATSLEATNRFEKVTFRPDQTNWVMAVSVFLNWQVRVSYLHLTKNPTPDVPAGVDNWGFSSTVRIQSVTHTLTPTDWTVAFDVDEPSSYDEIVSQPPTANGWDGGKWDIALWDEMSNEAAYWDSGEVWVANATPNTDGATAQSNTAYWGA